MLSGHIIFIASGILCGLGTSIALAFFLKKRKKTEELDELKNTTFVFSGNLKQTSLLDAVQFLEIGRREGILHVYCGRRKGYLTFSKGQVIDAFYRNHTAKEAVLQMFDIEEGDFYFEPKSIHQPRIINDSILDLAFEWDERKNQSSKQIKNKQNRYPKN